MSRLLASIGLLSLLSSTACAAACSRCPISIAYTTPAGCPALNCIAPTCTVTSFTTYVESYCSTKTRTACPRSCSPCYTETVTMEDFPTIVPDPDPVPLPSPTDVSFPDTTANPDGPIDLPSPTSVPPVGLPSPISVSCAPYTVTTTAEDPSCTFDTSTCIRPLCVYETTTTVPSCGDAVTETELAACATECPAGCATFTYTTTAGAESTATAGTLDRR
ncbi:hypothetical protein E4T47_03203 [Aureobasidium subglaciale]|nr:hypothetical protein E4T47_03203 [Aureobasidium subglaciale]